MRISLTQARPIKVDVVIQSRSDTVKMAEQRSSRSLSRSPQSKFETVAIRASRSPGELSAPHGTPHLRPIQCCQPTPSEQVIDIPSQPQPRSCINVPQENLPAPQLEIEPAELIAGIAEWNFVEEPPEMYNCAICLATLKEPHLPTCCGQNHICLACVNNVKASTTVSHGCPLCKAPAERFKTRLDVDMTEKILNLVVRCPQSEAGCEQMCKIRDVEPHLRHHCQYVTIVCPNGCKIKALERRSLNVHLKQCGYAIVQCPFRSVGCSGVVQRRNLTIHLEQCASEHLKRVSDKTAQISSKSEARIQQLRTECLTQHDAKENKVAALKLKAEAVKATIASLEKRLQLAQEKIVRLYEEQRRSAANNEAELLVKERKLKQVRDVYLNVEGRIVAMPTPVSTGFVTPPVVFTVGDFHERQKNDEFWIGPPFYTHEGGYKMCLGVYPNGNTDNRGTHLSVYVHFMEGEYDGQLQWPFEGQLTITALNQQTRLRGMVDRGANANYRRKICLDTVRSYGSRSRVFGVGYGSGWGISDFLPLGEVGKYLTWSGNLNLKVLNVMFLPL